MGEGHVWPFKVTQGRSKRCQMKPGGRFTKWGCRLSKRSPVWAKLDSGSGRRFGVPNNKQAVLVGTACCHRHLVSQWVVNQLNNVRNDALRDTFNAGRLPLRCRPNGDIKWRHLGVTFMSETVSAQQREMLPKLATFLAATCMSLDDWNGPLMYDYPCLTAIMSLPCTIF